MRKFMMAVNKEMYQLLEAEARQREISLQELFRAVVLADWLKQQGKDDAPISVKILSEHVKDQSEQTKT